MKNTTTAHRRVAGISLVLAIVFAYAVLAPLMIAVQPEGSGAFVDVPEDHWAYETIEWCAKYNVINGFGDGTFEPNGTVTYAQFYKMLTVYENRTVRDVAADEPWWTPYMEIAQELGFTAGTAMEDAYTNGSWDKKAVESPINRYEMAQVVANVVNWDLATGSVYGPEGIEPLKEVFAKADELFSDPTNGLAQNGVKRMTSIADEDSIPAKYLDAVKLNYKYLILQGADQKGTFAGTENLTRAQAVMVIYRMAFRRNDATGPLTPEEKWKYTPDLIGTGYTLATSITAPATGYLTNGKPITTENVQELLRELKEAYPSMMDWNEDMVKYRYRSRIAPCVFDPNTQWGGCGAFAFMLTEQLFGNDPKINPVRVHQDYDDVKVGDIIVKWLPGSPARSVEDLRDYDKFNPYISHLNVITDIVYTDTGEKLIYTAGGNEGSVVQWHAWDWEILLEKWSTSSWNAYFSVDNMIEDGDFIITRW